MCWFKKRIKIDRGYKMAIETTHYKLKKADMINDILNMQENLDKIDTAIYEASQNGGGITEIPIASATTLGGIKIGQGLDITADGTASVTVSDGREIELIRADVLELATHKELENYTQEELNSSVVANALGFAIAWRYVNDTNWHILCTLDEIRGDKGDKGDVGATFSYDATTKTLNIITE